MAEYKDREHYIPLHKSDLVHLLCADTGMTAEMAADFRRFAEMIGATFHFEYLKTLEELKEAYAPFDPDSVTAEVRKLSPQERQQRIDDLFINLGKLMERANFKRLTKADLEAATKEVSLWGLNMDVDFSIFEKVDAYFRGAGIGCRYKRRLWRFWKVDPIELPMYTRFVLAVKLKKSKRLPDTIDTNDIFLKLFKDIPRMDIEMLLPGAAMKMPGMTRLKMGGSIVSGLGMIGYSVVKQILVGAALGIGALMAPIAALFGYGYRQYSGYQSTKTAFALQLTQSLYYQTLGNNLGVLQHLLDEAEEQDVREALLAYYYLWRFAGDKGWDAESLDDYIEMDLERLAGIKVDFEVDDGLGKLERLGLVTKNGDNHYVAAPIDRALETLDYAWDNFFQYNKGAAV